MECSLIISSYDGFRDAWMPFSYLFKKYWGDCPFNIYAITNHKTFPIGKTYLAGDDRGWANNITELLNTIETPYVLYMQEDYFIKSKVNTDRILVLLEQMKELKGDYLRLYPVPPPDEVTRIPAIGINRNSTRYVNSLQASFWVKDRMLDLIKPNETAWDFEIKGMKRAYLSPFRFLCVHTKAIDYVMTGITKGKWNPESIKLFEKEKLDADLTRRGICD
jgi:hypothetical protein